MRNVWFLLRKEILQALRDKQLVRLVFIVPIIQLVMFGYVASTDVKNISTVFVDYDHTAASRELIGRFTNSGYFIPKLFSTTGGAIQAALDGNLAQVAVVIPRGYERTLAAGDTAHVQIVVDGTDTNTGVQAQNYAVRIVGAKADEIIQKKFSRFTTLGIRVATLDSRSRVWFNPDLATVNYMIPGLIGMLLSIVTVQLTSQAVVKERAAGTLEQLLVTPVKRWQIILGKILPFGVLGFLNVIMITVVGILWFGVPFRGNVLLLLGLSTAFLFAMLGQGLFVSTISKTQQQASVTSQLLTIPNFLLSGFIFPISAMPVWMQYVTYAIPLRYFLVIVRGIFLKGATLGDLRDPVIGLSILGLVTFGFAVSQFSKRLED
jgi:ABC-2 type transport system permease protein